MEKQLILDKINKMSKGTMMEHLAIEITDIDNGYIIGKMPVDNRTIQPFGLLHGGASATLAESLGSIIGNMQVDMEEQTVVGVEISANHLKSVKSGWVTGKATPLKIGRRLQVWNIQITNDNNELVCDSRLTLAVVKK